LRFPYFAKVGRCEIFCKHFDVHILLLIGRNRESHASLENINYGYRRKVCEYLISANMFSQRLGEALETAVATMALEPVDRLSTIEDRVSMLLGEQVPIV
jgi:hypothetical protein